MPALDAALLAIALFLLAFSVYADLGHFSPRVWECQDIFLRA
jgi:hypothetical protein